MSGQLGSSTSPALSSGLPDPMEYSKNALNDPRRGVDYEEENVIYAFLTLKTGQELAREVQLDKLDDLVLRVNEGNTESFYIRQLKRKESSTKSIAWNDLLGKANKDYQLKTYFEAFLKADLINISTNSTGHNAIKEIALNTNISFRSNNTGKSNFKPFLSNQSIRWKITETDVGDYFQVVSDSIWDSSFLGNGKKYKLTSLAITEIENVLVPGPIANQSNNSVTVKEFLGKLVFEVMQADIETLKEKNRSTGRIYAPFYSNYYEPVRNEILNCIDSVRVETNLVNNKPSPKYFAKWIKTTDREQIFLKLIPNLKEQTDLGSVPGYEIRQLVPLLNDLQLNLLDDKTLRNKSKWYPDLERFLKNDSNESPREVMTLYSKNSKATVTALKVYKLLENSSLLNQSLVIQIKNEADVGRVINYFQSLNEDLKANGIKHRMHFCFIVEMSPIIPRKEVIEQSSRLFVAFSDLEDLRKWIQFVVITETRQKLTSEKNVKYTKDKPLKWGDLPKETQNLLFDKVLSIGLGLKTTLKMLGLENTRAKKWIKSRALAELMVYTDVIPLPFPLPKNKEEIEITYIKRKIKLPCVVKEKIANELVRRRYGLSDGNEWAYIWSQTNKNKGFQVMKSFVTPSEKSTLAFDECCLLQDDKSFGSGSDNRLAIVVDYPGKGKSTLLGSLSNTLKMNYSEKNTDNQHLLLLNINLADCPSKSFKEIKSVHEAIDFLFNNALSFIELSRDRFTEVKDWPNKQLVNTIVRQLCLNQSPRVPVFVFLDSFDEIIDQHREITCQLIEQLLQNARGIKRIILTSRPNDTFREYLEDRFQRFVLHLKEFDEKDQIECLKKQWQWKLNKENPELVKQSEKIEEFAKFLVGTANRMLNDENKSFLGVPLQCYIFSECFLPNLINFLENGEKPLFGSDVFDLLRLYENFYENKLNIYLQEKAKLEFGNTSKIANYHLLAHNQDTFLEILKRLAIFYMMKDVRKAQFLIQQLSWNVYRCKQYSEEIQKAMELGYLTKVEKPGQTTNLERPDVKFIHRTFAENFAARFFFDNFKENKSEILDGDFLPKKYVDEAFAITIETLVSVNEYAGIRRFLDCMLGKIMVNEPTQTSVDACDVSNKGQKNHEQQVENRSLNLIGHEQFNSFLARILFPKQESGNNQERFTCAPLNHFKDYLVEILFDRGSNANIASWLLLCIEEHGARIQSKTIPCILNLIRYSKNLTSRSVEEYKKEFNNIFYQIFYQSEYNGPSSDGGGVDQESAQDTRNMIKDLLKFILLRQGNYFGENNELLQTNEGTGQFFVALRTLVVIAITMELERFAQKQIDTRFSEESNDRLAICDPDNCLPDDIIVQFLKGFDPHFIMEKTTSSLKIENFQTSSFINSWNQLLTKEGSHKAARRFYKCLAHPDMLERIYDPSVPFVLMEEFLSSVVKVAIYNNWFAQALFGSNLNSSAL